MTILAKSCSQSDRVSVFREQTATTSFHQSILWTLTLKALIRTVADKRENRELFAMIDCSPPFELSQSAPACRQAGDLSMYHCNVNRARGHAVLEKNSKTLWCQLCRSNCEFQLALCLLRLSKWAKLCDSSLSVRQVTPLVLGRSQSRLKSPHDSDDTRLSDPHFEALITTPWWSIYLTAFFSFFSARPFLIR